MKTFLVITTTEYESIGIPSVSRIDTNHIKDLEQYGWDTAESYCLLNTDKDIKISQMKVGDCVESNEFYGKDATLYRIR